MKEQADFSNKDWFVRENSDRVEAVDFDDVWIIVMEMAVKVQRLDAMKYQIREYVVIGSGHILWIRRGWEQASEGDDSRCNEQ